MGAILQQLEAESCAKILAWEGFEREGVLRAAVQAKRHLEVAAWGIRCRRSRSTGKGWKQWAGGQWAHCSGG